mgnify:CR=1 FL=1
MDSWNKGMDIRIQKPIIEMSMKQVIFQNMAIKRMKNKSKKLMKHYYNNEITLEELAESVKEAENDNGYSHKDFLVLTNYQEEISSHLFDAVDWQYPDTLFNE